MYDPRSRPTTLHVAEDIVPIAKFKSHLSEMVRGLADRGRPVVVTQNGKAAAVVLSPEEFDRLSYRARFLAAVDEGVEDAQAGRTVSHAALGRRLDERFGALPKTKRNRR